MDSKVRIELIKSIPQIFSKIRTLEIHEMVAIQQLFTIHRRLSPLLSYSRTDTQILTDYQEIIDKFIKDNSKKKDLEEFIEQNRLAFQSTDIRSNFEAIFNSWKKINIFLDEICNESLFNDKDISSKNLIINMKVVESYLKDVRAYFINLAFDLVGVESIYNKSLQSDNMNVNQQSIDEWTEYFLSTALSRVYVLLLSKSILEKYIGNGIDINNYQIDEIKDISEDASLLKKFVQIDLNEIDMEKLKKIVEEFAKGRSTYTNMLKFQALIVKELNDMNGSQRSNLEITLQSISKIELGLRKSYAQLVFDYLNIDSSESHTEVVINICCMLIYDLLNHYHNDINMDKGGLYVKTGIFSKQYFTYIELKEYIKNSDSIEMNIPLKVFVHNLHNIRDEEVLKILGR